MAEEAVADVTIVKPKTGEGTLKKITPEQLAEKINKKNAAPPVEKTAEVDKGKLNNKTTEELPANKINEKITPETKLGEDGKPIEAKLGEDGKPIEPAKPTKKSLRESVKPFSNKKETQTPEGEVVIPETVKAKLTDYEKQIAERDSILSDPDVKAFLEIKKAGKSAIDIFKESVGNAIDTKKMTDAQAYEYGLKASGVKPAAELDKDSEEPSLEDEMAKFKDMGRIAQKREADAIRSEIDKNQSNQNETFLNKLISHNEKSQLEVQAQRQVEAQKIDSLTKGISEWADAYSKGIEHYSVIGDPKLAESIKNFKLVDLIFPTKEDGSLDAEKVADLIHYSLTKDLRLDNIEKQYFAQGFDELKKEVEVTKGATQGLSRAPQGTKQPQSEQEVVQKVHSGLRPVSVGHASIRQ